MLVTTFRLFKLGPFFRKYSTKDLFSNIPLRNLKPKSTIERKSKFIDYIKVTLKAGNGGDGRIQFSKFAHHPLSGPDGGDGGNGGHVILKGTKNLKSLSHIKTTYHAEKGEEGGVCNMTGKSAEHTIIEVPIGTIVSSECGTTHEIKCNEEEFIIAHGGAGGHGNAFYLSNKNRHPGIAEIGGEGEMKKCELELRLMAHAGLIGFPNAGKSTFLQAISRARPKVAGYPFTTLNPHIGMVLYGDYIQIAVADLPGLLPGAHKNHGLGISFLRHVERCLCLFYLIDFSQDNPLEQYSTLRYELNQYKEGLSDKPHAILANKMDLEGTKEKLELFKENVDAQIFPISAKYGQNLRNVLVHLRKLYDEHNHDQLGW